MLRCGLVASVYGIHASYTVILPDLVKDIFRIFSFSSIANLNMFLLHNNQALFRMFVYKRDLKISFSFYLQENRIKLIFVLLSMHFKFEAPKRRNISRVEQRERNTKVQ